ncbi:MAG: type II toxin-antitoxin system ParD family antitoxin [Bacteroidia bacterium]|nr:type II toxin-antitoxin system ParD family antitoxin [Bacteroidia bacterium]
MNISLTPTLEALVQAKVSSGLYNNASEVIREALRLMEEQDQLKKLKIELLKKELISGAESLDRGESSDFTVNQIAERVLKNYHKE